METERVITRLLQVNVNHTYPIYMSPADTKSILVFLTHESVNIPTMMPHPYVSIKDTTGITLILKEYKYIMRSSLNILSYRSIIFMWYHNCERGADKVPRYCCLRLFLPCKCRLCLCIVT